MLMGLLVRGNDGCGPRVHKRKRGRGVGGQKHETECDGSVSGCNRALRNAGGFREVRDPPDVVI